MTNDAIDTRDVSQESTKEPTRRSLAEGMLLLITIIWGGTFAATSELIDSGLEPVPLVLWRFGAAAILLLPIFFLTKARSIDRGTLRVGLVLGLLLYAGFVLQTIGLETTSSSRSGFITALYVVITPLLQPLFGRRRPGLRVWTSVTLIVVGLWLLIGPGGSTGLTAGDVQTFFCALFFAIFIIVLDRYGRETEVIGLTTVQTVTVSICALLHFAIIDGFARPATAVVPQGTTPLLLLGYLSIFGTLFTMWGQNRYQPWTTPSRAAIIFTMESVFAALIGVLVLGEVLGVGGWAGGAFIVIGLLLVELPPELLGERVVRMREEIRGGRGRRR